MPDGKRWELEDFLKPPGEEREGIEVPPELLGRMRGMPVGELIPAYIPPQVEQIEPVEPESKIKDIWDAFFLSAASLWQRSKQYFVSALPNMIFSDMPVPSGLSRKEMEAQYETRMKEIWEKYPQPPYTAEQMKEPWYSERTAEQAAAWDERGVYVDPTKGLFGMPISQVEEQNVFNKKMRGIFSKVYEENKQKHWAWLREHPELQPRPEWNKGVIETFQTDPSTALDPAFWAYVVADAAPFTLAVLGTTLTVSLATGNPFIGLATGIAAATPAESQDLYEDLIASGATESQAGMLAVPIGGVIGSVEALSDLPLLAAISAPFHALLTRNISREVARQTVRELLAKGLETFTMVEIAEITEEVLQGAIHNATVKTIDEGREILEGVSETAVRTAIAVLPFGFLGGGGRIIQERRVGVPPVEEPAVRLEVPTPEVAPEVKVAPVVEPTVQGLVDKGKVEFDRLADTGRVAPFGGDVIEEQTTNELKAVVEGRKPVALIAQMDAAEARKLGLVVRRVTAKGERVAGMAEVYGAYKKGNKAALDKLNEVFAKEVTGELKGAEMDVALGGALGYSEADIAKYMQSVHGSYEEFVKATTPEVAPAVPETISIFRGQRPKLTQAEFATDPGDLGAGIYYTDYKPTAKVYGDVTKVTKTFNNPLRLSSEEAIKLSEKYKTVTGATIEERLAGARQMSRDLVAQGYDALIVEGYETPKGTHTIVDLSPFIEAKPPAVEVIPTELTEQEILRTTPIGKLKAKEVADVGIRDIVNKIKGIDIKALPLEYKTQIRDILNDFDIAFRTKKTLTKRASLRAYIERLKADGIEVTVPQSYIDVAYKTALADMTTEQVQMLHDMVQGLVKLGQLKNKLLRVQAGRRVDEAEKAIVDHLGVPPEEGIISKAAFEQGWYHRTLEKYKGFIARTDRMERLLLMLDGYEPNGLMWQTFYDPINTATDQKLFGVQKSVEDFRAFLREQDIDIKRIISVRKEVIPGVELTSSERIGVYLHSLNRDNLAHLKYGNKIDEKTIEAVINQMTPDEIAVAEYLGGYFRDAAPSVSRVRTEVEGKSLEVVENYFPIILERRAETTFMSQERKLIEEALQDFGKEMSLEDEYRFTSKWASARIAKQFIRKRTHRALQPVSLDALEIFIRRMEAMEHYKAFAPPIRDLQLLLNRADVQKAIVNKGGKPVLQVMDRWLKDVAKTNPLAVTSQGEKLLRTLRVNAVTAVLGINLTTAMKQIPSMLIGAAEIGNIPALKGILTSIVHPIETRQMIKDMAPQIYRRSIERELAEAKMMRNLEKRLTDRLSPREAFMFLTVTCDRFVVNGLWRGAFEDYLKKNPGQVNEAATSATAAIRRTQPFFSIKDLPEYWRSGEFMKALTMFTNQLNQYWNYYRHDTFGAAIAGKVGFGTVVKRVLEGFVLSALIIGWITRSRPPQDAEDVVEDLASMAFATLPLVGHFIVGGYQGFHSDSGLITTEVASMLQELAYYMNKEEWDRAALVIPELGGYIAGVPVAQPKRVIEALINIASGKTDDWLEIIWGQYRREKARKEEREKKRETPGLFREPEGKFKIEDFLK